MDASQPTSQPVAGPSLAARNRRDGWLMVAPAVLLLLGLGIYPLVRALTLSFQRWELQSPEQPWVGLANYGEAIRDARVWASLQHTLVIVVFAVTLELLLGFGLALLLSGDFPGKRVVLPAMMLPVMMVPVVVGLTWRTLWDNQYGPINAVIGRIIGHPPNIVWLANQKTALVAIVVTDVWQWTPFMLLILLAGLTGVNPELYEAAALDGAGWCASLRDISLPGIAPVVAVAVLFRGLDAFKIFDLVFMFTQGGPGTSTETVSWYIYQLGFKFFRLSYASAVSFLILILLSVACTLYVGLFLRERTA